MENKRLKIRVNLQNREFEIDGDADYIMEQFGHDIQEYIEMIKTSKSNSNSQSVTTRTNGEIKNPNTNNNDDFPESFGEYLNKFPKTLSNVDKLLIASYYFQMMSSNKSFAVQDASMLLVDQGIKLSNASVFNKANMDAKKIFKLTGKTFRVSDTGVEHVKNLLAT